MIIRIAPANPLVFEFFWIEPTSITIARHPKVLHYQKPIFVARFIKLRPFGYGATPNPDKVQIHIPVKPDFGIIPLPGKPQHCIRNNPVSALYKNPLTIYIKLHTACAVVPSMGDFPYADLNHFPIRHLHLNVKLEFCRVKCLFAIAVRPPEFGVINAQGWQLVLLVTFGREFQC
jgi:hypothetical protein